MLDQLSEEDNKLIDQINQIQEDNKLLDQLEEEDHELLKQIEDKDKKLIDQIEDEDNTPSTTCVDQQAWDNLRSVLEAGASVPAVWHLSSKEEQSYTRTRSAPLLLLCASTQPSSFAIMTSTSHAWSLKFSPSSPWAQARDPYMNGLHPAGACPLSALRTKALLHHSCAAALIIGPSVPHAPSLSTLAKALPACGLIFWARVAYPCSSKNKVLSAHALAQAISNLSGSIRCLNVVANADIKDHGHYLVRTGAVMREAVKGNSSPEMACAALVKGNSSPEMACAALVCKQFISQVTMSTMSGYMNKEGKVKRSFVLRVLVNLANAAQAGIQKPNVSKASVTDQAYRTMQLDPAEIRLQWVVQTSSNASLTLLADPACANTACQTSLCSDQQRRA
ncbi:hypothetical protein JCM11251_006276 [Rhodosporidiobolus azoricus]